MTEEWFELLKKYAKRFSIKPEDADDILSEACILYFENLPDQEKLNKTFFWKLAKKGKYRLFYYNKKNEKDLTVIDNKSQEHVDNALDENTPEDIVNYKQTILDFSNIKLRSIEKIILDNILDDNYDYCHTDRTHLLNLRNKIKGRL